MSLNIKNRETDELIRKLAALKGVSLTYASSLPFRRKSREHKRAAGRAQRGDGRMVNED